MLLIEKEIELYNKIMQKAFHKLEKDFDNIEKKKKNVLGRIGIKIYSFNDKEIILSPELMEPGIKYILRGHMYNEVLACNTDEVIEFMIKISYKALTKTISKNYDCIMFDLENAYSIAKQDKIEENIRNKFKKYVWKEFEKEAMKIWEKEFPERIGKGFEDAKWWGDKE